MIYNQPITRSLKRNWCSYILFLESTREPKLKTFHFRIFEGLETLFNSYILGAVQTKNQFPNSNSDTMTVILYCSFPQSKSSG